MTLPLLPPTLPVEQLESRRVLKALTTARAALAELKGAAITIPNQQILIDTLSLQEAKDSSAIENIITTHDEVYRSNSERQQFVSASSKEVHRYAEALKFSFEQVVENRFITIKTILKIQEIIEGNSAGFRKLPGTVLKNDLTQEVIYTPPQNFDTIVGLMTNLEGFMNGEPEYPVDPLIKMALVHHQFESIHPFYDGNGRTGRILNILFLIKEDLLNLPILYLSRYLIRNRPAYYRLLQETRDASDWEEWILFMIKAVEVTSNETVILIRNIKSLMLATKTRIRNEQPRIYSQDLINNLFRHPYTKIELVQRDLSISRLTATKYLNILVDMEILNKLKMGRSNYYVNSRLFAFLQEQ